MLREKIYIRISVFVKKKKKFRKCAETERVRVYDEFRGENHCGVGGLSTGETRSRADAGANLGAGRRRSERVLRMYTNCGGGGRRGARARRGNMCQQLSPVVDLSAVAVAAARAFMHHYNM